MRVGATLSQDSEQVTELFPAVDGDALPESHPAAREPFSTDQGTCSEIAGDGVRVLSCAKIINDVFASLYRDSSRKHGS